MNQLHPLEKTQTWESDVQQQLLALGHRNWIVIADAAYPKHAAPGIATLVSNCDHLVAIDFVLRAIHEAKHVAPKVFLDRELDFIDENDAPGVSDFRRQLPLLLRSVSVDHLLHTDLIAKLDEAANLFSVLIIKTNLRLPYTSVFIELDCGYWNADAEQRLRSAMSKAQQ